MASGRQEHIYRKVWAKPSVIYNNSKIPVLNLEGQIAETCAETPCVPRSKQKKHATESLSEAVGIWTESTSWRHTGVMIHGELENQNIMELSTNKSTHKPT